MRHGYCFTKTPQNRRHVKVFEPEQATVCRVDEVVVADAFVELLAFTHVQDQFPFRGHERFGFYDRENILPKPLDISQGSLVVKVCVGINRL